MGICVVLVDWFFVRLMGERPRAFASEKKFYIQADIAEIWGEYKGLINVAEFNSKGRAVANARWVVGKEKIMPVRSLKKAYYLSGDPKDESVFNEPSP